MIIQPVKGGFALYDRLGVRIGERMFKSIPDGRRYAANHFQQVPILRTPTGVVFDRLDPLHRALARIEARHGMSHVVLVEPYKYWVTKVRYGPEISIKYRRTDTTVFARNRHEDIK